MRRCAVALIALIALPAHAALACDPNSDNRKMVIEYQEGFWFPKQRVREVDHIDQIVATGDTTPNGIFLCDNEKYRMSMDSYPGYDPNIDRYEPVNKIRLNGMANIAVKKVGGIYAHVVDFRGTRGGESIDIHLCAKPAVQRRVGSSNPELNDSRVEGPLDRIMIFCENAEFSVGISISKLKSGSTVCYVSARKNNLKINFFPSNLCDVEHPLRTLNFAVGLLSHLGMLDPGN